MNFKKKRANTKEEIPTTAMPDIVFMLLMFFMTVTTMRDIDVLVSFKLPEAKALEKIESKRLVSYIWVGKDKRMQINDSFIKMEEIEGIMYDKKQALPEIIVSLRSDQNVDMGFITDIQQALRKAYCLRINYSAMIKV
ncbi:MAG: biopolymer transporter ExbD [Ignavibacteriales bacterium]|nr:MAG: biopolymer transporter ExbD [Ignavibacteriales bacterium]